MAPEPQNPAGFGERLDVALFNDRLLESLGWYWDAPDPSPLSDPPARPAFVAEGRSIVHQQLSGPRPFVLKDPRISLLLPWWRQILFDRFVPVVVLRDPAEVAWSLKMRDGFPMELGLALWAAYHRHLAAGLSGMEPIAVDFEKLCDKPQATLGRVFDALGSLGVDATKNVRAAARAIRPLLRRATQPNNVAAETAAAPAIRDIRRQWLADAASVRSAFDASSAPPSDWERALLAVHRAARDAKAHQNGLRNQLAETQSRLGSVSAHKSELEQRVADLAAEVTGLEREAADIRRQLQTAVRDRDSARATVAELNQQLSDVTTKQLHVQQAVTALRQRIKFVSRERDEASHKVSELETRVERAVVEGAAAELATVGLRGEMASLRDRLAAAERERRRLLDGNTDLQRRLAEIQTENHQHESRIAVVTAERVALEHVNRVSEQMIEAIRGERDAARTTVAEFQSQFATISAHQAESDRLAAELRHELDEAKRDRDSLQGALVERDARAAALSQMNSALRAELEAAHKRAILFNVRRLINAIRYAYRRAIVQLPQSLVALVWQNPLFDTEWYAAHYPDVRGARLGPEWHFRRHGVREARNPNAFFETAWYSETNPDVRRSGINPLDHYLLYGAKEQRNPSSRFDTAWYLAANTDVAASGLNPLEHYLRHGLAEGRQPTRGPVAVKAPAESEPEGTSAYIEGDGSPIAEPSVDAEPAPRSEIGAADGHADETSPARRTSPVEPTDGVSAGAQRARSAISMPSPPKDFSRIDGESIVDDVRVIAFYRSAFYPDDLSLLKGKSSEWHYVAKASSRTDGHSQLRLPGELGFYDLRLAETRREQADLARSYGIHAFCYEQIWGYPELYTAPYDEMIRSGEPDFPFTLRMSTGFRDPLKPVASMLTADWLGSNLDQLRPALESLGDSRAITVDGNPMLILEGLEGDEGKRAAAFVRREAVDIGLENAFLVAATRAGDRLADPDDVGADAALELHPDGRLVRQAPGRKQSRRLVVTTYDEYARMATAAPARSDWFQTVVSGWNDLALNASGSLVLVDATPDSYGEWLRRAVAKARDHLPIDRRFVFVASWNDWARGSHLEPELVDGRAYLEATRLSLVREFWVEELV